MALLRIKQSRCQAPVDSEKGRFAWGKRGKINFIKLSEEKAWRNLRSGEKFHQAGGGGWDHRLTADL